MKNRIIEALLYIQGEEGLSSEQLQEVLELNTINEARKLLKDFVVAFNKLERGIKAVEFNDVFKLVTIEPLEEYVSKLVTAVRKHKLSNAAIETAGIIAYKQPVTRSMVSDIRGVSSDSIVASLLLKGIIEEVGVSPTPGNPTLYGITNKFYDYFKIKSLQELPKFPEFNDFKEVDGETVQEEQESFDLFSSQREDE